MAVAEGRWVKGAGSTFDVRLAIPDHIGVDPLLRSGRKLGRANFGVSR
jgi:hypothetical protein